MMISLYVTVLTLCVVIYVMFKNYHSFLSFFSQKVDDPELLILNQKLCDLNKILEKKCFAKDQLQIKSHRIVDETNKIKDKYQELKNKILTYTSFLTTKDTKFDDFSRIN